jgi:hypothetical protein
MEHLSFLLWMLLYPIAVSIESYIAALKDKVNGEKKEYSKDVKFYYSLFILAIYFIVAAKLF